jgi:hypothetical protein
VKKRKGKELLASQWETVGSEGRGRMSGTKKRVKRFEEEKVITKLFLRGGEGGHEGQSIWNDVPVAYFKLTIHLERLRNITRELNQSSW